MDKKPYIEIESEKMPIQTIKCVPVSYLIPISMLSLKVWEKISHNSPFCYGSNNHSLVSPTDFYAHCERRLGIKYNTLLEKIKSIPQDVYIDLEN